MIQKINTYHDLAKYNISPVNGTFIVPMGDNNDMPGEVMRLLDKFYAGEGMKSLQKE